MIKPMNDTGRAFLAEICNDPSNDVPRLTYADWLDEHGESERAEFVRVQCELAKNLNGSTAIHSASEWHRLRRRERELFLKIPCSTWEPFPADLSCTSRGFRSKAVLEWGQWLRIADAVYWREVPCEACDGTGSRQSYDPASDTYRRTHGECPACRGRGTAPPMMECPTCKGTGDLGTLEGRHGCYTCGGYKQRGTGRITRPCPETAQPIEEVRLTTLPEGSEWVGEEFLLEYCKTRWPGVRFVTADAVAAIGGLRGDDRNWG